MTTEIVLAAATLVVAACVLYVTITLGPRTRRYTEPMIDGVTGQLNQSAVELRQQLQAVVGEVRQDRDQIRLDERKTQGRLDHADSRMTTIAHQLLTEIDALRRQVEQLDQHVAQLTASQSASESEQPHEDPTAPRPRPPLPGG
jgi:outer membrane murein-binding lipoprotein Lpp